MSSAANESLFLGHTFKAQSMLDILTWKHNDYPVFDTSEFTFFRCLSFKDEFYGRTISELHRGNLREGSGRYSSLFPNQRISYWSSDRMTAKREVSHHEDCRDYILFEAYDDASSFIPSLPDQAPLRIADARETVFGSIINKVEEEIALTDYENRVLDKILDLKLDCLAYISHVDSNGENFLFLEKGFRKLALREVRLILGSRTSRNTNRVQCAITSDYQPILESYGKRFEPIAKVTEDLSYFETGEYMLRKAIMAQS